MRNLVLFTDIYLLSRISFGFFDNFAVLCSAQKRHKERRLFARSNIPVFRYNSPSSFGDILRTLAGQMGPALGIDEAGNVIGVVTSEFLWLLWGYNGGLFVSVVVTQPTCARQSVQLSGPRNPLGEVVSRREMDHLRPKTSMTLEIIGSLRHNPAIQEVLRFDFILRGFFGGTSKHLSAPAASMRRYEVLDSNFGDPGFWVFGLSDTAVCAHLEKHAAKQANQNTPVNNRPPSNYHK